MAPFMRRSLCGLAARAAALAALAACLGCPSFHQTGPEDPAPLPLPTTVEITIEYVQPNGCVSQTVSCQDPVVFLGSWMHTGDHVELVPDASHHVWVGRTRGVPVNFPPTGNPYDVRIYDPFLQSDASVRYTGRRLKVGGQELSDISTPGGHLEAALVFVDANGIGHNPF